MLEQAPERPEVAERLAWVLATSRDDAVRDPRQALRLARALNQATGFGDYRLLETLAAALAANEETPKAVRRQQEALRLAPPRERPALQARLELYAAGRALHEGP